MSRATALTSVMQQLSLSTGVAVGALVVEITLLFRHSAAMEAADFPPAFLVVGAFTAAVVASAVGVLWLGLISGSLAGGLVGAVLALFAIRWFVDQIILGVVLNLLISGITGYLYDRLLVPQANTYNNATTFSAVKIPGLGDIPVIGPIFFDSTIFLYITYVAIIAVQIGLFSTRPAMEYSPPE